MLLRFVTRLQSSTTPLRATKHGAIALFVVCTSSCAPSASTTKTPAPSPNCVTPRPFGAIPRVSPSASSAASSTVSTPRLDEPVILEFDCFKDDVATEPQCTTASNAPTPLADSSLRHWRGGGGPDGAAWNAMQVTCRALVRSPCASGAVTLRVANKAIHRASLLDATPTQLCTFSLEYDDFEKHFDDPPAPSVEPVYRTAVFRLELAQGCGDPTYLAVTHDEFTAGFAFGE